MVATCQNFKAKLINAGRTEEATADYRKSLALNPANANATQMLKKLEGE